MSMEPAMCKTNNYGLKRKLTEDATTRACKISCVNLENGALIGSCTHGCDCRLRQPKLADNCHNYLNSNVPRRILFYDRGQWSDFPEPVMNALIDGFKKEKSCSKVMIGEDHVLVDLLSMAMVNMRTKKQYSVAWIDESDKCFFPNHFSDAGVEYDAMESPNTVNIGPPEAEKSGSYFHLPMVAKDVGTEHRALIPNRPFKPERQRSKMENVGRDSQTFLFVQNIFLSGMGQYATPSNVLKIQRYVPIDIPARKRLVAFERRIRSRREELGDANVRCGWFGGKKIELARILSQGFGMEANPIEGMALGTCTYLTPDNRAFASVKLCDVDEKGIQHILLCRIILGNMEEIKPGSNESFSSSSEFDSVVDDRLCPKLYILQHNSVHTYFHPEYLISFKLVPKIREYLVGLNDACLSLNSVNINQSLSFLHPDINGPVNGPTSSWISFPALLAEVKEKLSPITKKLLDEHYNDFRRYKSTRECFISKVREIVGDKLIMSAFEKLKQCPSAWKNGTAAKRKSADSPESVSVELTLGPTDSSSLNFEPGPYVVREVHSTVPAEVDSNPASFSLILKDSSGQKIEYDVSSALNMALLNEVTAGEPIAVSDGEDNGPASMTAEPLGVGSLPAVPVAKG